MTQELREPTRKQMLEAIAEYFAKARRLFESKDRFVPSGANEISCPKCESASPGMIYQQRSWRCLHFHCKFAFPEELAPPGPQELAELFVLAKRLRAIAVWNNLLYGHGVSI
ncbi:MAG: hypothetical protein Q8Q41_04710 [bacterium]|nr:hypothetical protein [bacterium]